MKRFFSLLLILSAGMVFSTSSFAASRDSEEYKKISEYKKAQREKKLHPAVNPEKSFWRKEAERSGLGGTAAMFGNAVGGIIPLDKPNSHKEAK